jgi:hypothetical protein
MVFHDRPRVGEGSNVALLSDGRVAPPNDFEYTHSVSKTTVIAAFPPLPSKELRIAEAIARAAQRSGRSAALAAAIPPEPLPLRAESAAPAEAAPGQRKARTKSKKAQAEEPANGDRQDEPTAAEPRPKNDDGILRIPFRAGSSLSARTVFLESANALGPVVELVICLEPGRDGGGILSSGPAEAEAFAEERVKACFQLLREAGQRFAKLPGSSIAIALPDSPGLSGFARLERDFLRSLGDACMAERGLGGRVFGLAGDAADADGFAAALFRLLDDPKSKGSGKWSGGKGGFLGRF